MASPADVGEVAAVRPDLSIPEQHVTAEAGEDVDYVAMPKASCQRASVLLYLEKAGYDIKLVHSDGFTRAMSQVKWSIPNPFGSTAPISSTALSQISSAKRSRICELYMPSSPFCHF